ncbi:DeoR family transcriptional regulator [Herbiconiux liangxiaofengii]|uniref:DeoR family transcriptional regulator n=1 Tax=Herbiconiux liangxiaofengii TaxID=3342795 RepID=UPI0035B954C6
MTDRRSGAGTASAPSGAVAERRERILVALEQHRRVEVAELAVDLDVAEETVRRDLRALESEGLLHRAHGGAIAVDLGVDALEPLPGTPGAPGGPEVDAARGARLVAATVRDLLPAGATVYLDAGAVGEALAALLPADRVGRIITPSVSVALAAAAVARPADIQLLGGRVESDSTAVGPWARELAGVLRVDVAVIEPRGIGTGGRMLALDSERASIGRAVIAAARRTVVVVGPAGVPDDGCDDVAAVADVDDVVLHPRAAARLDDSIASVFAEAGTPVHVVAEVAA